MASRFRRRHIAKESGHPDLHLDSRGGAQWDQAIKGLDTPVASPYAVTFYTLPRHWLVMDEVKLLGCNVQRVFRLAISRSVPERTQDFWKVEEKTIDDVNFRRASPIQLTPDNSQSRSEQQRRTKQPRRRGDHPKCRTRSKQCAMLQIKAKKAFSQQTITERTQFSGVWSVRRSPYKPGASSCKSASLIRITTEAIKASQDARFLFYDSVGGEPPGPSV